jgi:hypothetical protein
MVVLEEMEVILEVWVPEVPEVPEVLLALAVFCTLEDMLATMMELFN